MATQLDRAKKQAAQKVADKLTAKNTDKTSKNLPNVATVTVAYPTNTPEIKVPGLLLTNPDVSSLIPNFNPNEYQITDPLNPGELPQITQQQFDQGMTIYEGSQRALKLTGAAIDTTRERFVVMGKHSKMVGEGVKAATEGLKAEGIYIDYLTQSETNKQKAIGLDIAATKTATDTSISTHTKVELGEKLKQAQMSAELAQAKSAEVLGKLTEFKKQLGQYLPQS